MIKVCIDNCFENNYAKLIIWQSERLKFAELMYGKEINECIEPYLVALFDARDSFFFYGWSLKFINYEGKLPKFDESNYKNSFAFDEKKSICQFLMKLHFFLEYVKYLILKLKKFQKIFS